MGDFIEPLEEERKKMRLKMMAEERTIYSAMAGWVIKHSGGRIKDERQATAALLVFAVVGVLLSFFIFFWGTGPTQHPEIKGPPPEAINGGQ